MGILEGLLGGFGKAASENQRLQIEEKSRQSDLEQRIFSTLAGSTDPDIQSLAVQGMLTSASGKGKGSKSFTEALFGKGGTPSPALGELMGKLSGRSGAGGAPAAQPEESFVEAAGKRVMPGANTPAADIYGGETTATALPQPSTPEPIFKSPAEVQLETSRRGREEYIRELEGRGAPPEAIEEAVYGVRRMQPQRPVSVPRGGTAIDPYTGEALYQDPRGPATTRSQYRSVSPGGVIFDETTGKPVYYAPRADSEGTKDRPEYLDAVAAQKQVDQSIKGRFGIYLETARPGSATETQIRKAQDELAQQFGYDTYQELQRQAGFRRTTPPPLAAPGGAPSPQATVMGDPAADDQRMAIIVEKYRAFKQGAGPEPSAQDIEFAQAYMAAYPQQ